MTTTYERVAAMEEARQRLIDTFMNHMMLAASPTFVVKTKK